MREYMAGTDFSKVQTTRGKVKNFFVYMVDQNWGFE